MWHSKIGCTLFLFNFKRSCNQYLKSRFCWSRIFKTRHIPIFNDVICLPFSTGSSDQTPVRPVRRHSFNSCKSSSTTTTPATTAESGDSHYEADVESGTGSSSCPFSRDPGSHHINDNGSSYSDSEAGSQPIKGRIRSLWGSFRKKRMEVVVQVRTASRPAPPPPPTNSLYSCFGEYGDRALENGETEPQLQRLSNHGSDSATNSSSSYHTPGSPIKQQSESSSSLSRCLFIFYNILYKVDLIPLNIGLLQVLNV